MLELGLAAARHERGWVAEFVAEVEGGGLSFAGEPRGWQPADDDPGWQMHRDRERYQQLLGR